ncbi:YfhO family protein [Streptococcus himalayensis]|uniref:Copper ABC transporter permease n=1 Tax=Streptococcus himalayensis TaxID=1888195 RepID=A0A917A2Z5_9STRE|nr:YfhO family protein [Streptococcus himalayensis]GGE23965.1 copper ABC transporter permease [Streptococcus himalayensis]
MKNSYNILKKHGHYPAAFLIPALIMTVSYASQGIYWGSSTSPLLGDGFHQYVIFDTTLRNILHGSDSLFYTFTSGLGLNFYALSSYYLGSFLSPLVYFFDVHSMPDAVYLLTILKFGLMGLTSFMSLKGIFKHISHPHLLLLSTSYALMSFATSQLEIKTWLDVFILFPIILLGLHRLITQRKRVLYFTSLSILFIQNYYFGYMVAIFLTLWYLVQLSWDFKQRIKSFGDFFFVSLLAGLTSMIMLLPTFLDLRTHGEKLTKVSTLWTEDSWYLDFFAKNFIGSFDTTKYGSIPMIYVGLIPLIFAVLFFFLKQIQFHVKLLYGLLLGILIASFYLSPLDLFWQGMHAPNMFLHRYSWLLSVVILYMAAESLERLKDIHLWHFLLSFFLLFIGFLATFIYRQHYDFLGMVQYTLTVEFLVAYLLIFTTFFKKSLPKHIFLLASLFFAVFELGLNTFYQIDGIASEWVFSSRDSYAKDSQEMNKLVNFAKQENDEFFRTEKLVAQTGNDSMKYNYNGISQFSSVRNTAASSTMDKLGFKSSGTNLNLRYQNNSILMDSLMAIKYNISESNPNKYGFTPLETAEHLTLFENKNSLPLAILSNNRYKDVKFDNLTLDNQSKFLNQLSGLDLQYYYRLTPKDSQATQEINGRITVNADASNDEHIASASYTIDIPANSQVYLTLAHLTFSNSDKEAVDITVNDQTMHYSLNNVFPFFNLGYFKEKTTATIRISFPDNKHVSFNTPEFYRVNTEHFQEAIDTIKEQDVTVISSKNTVTAHYQAQKDTSLIFTLPYDKGWTATQDGKPLPIQKVQKGLMKVDVKKGNGIVTLHFIPQGFKIGSICFFSGILLFIFYHRWQNRQTNRHS